MPEETEVEETEQTEEHPEPQPVGHQVVQDNVTEPGVQTTRRANLETGEVETSVHEDAAAASEAPAEDESDDEAEGEEPDDAGAGGDDADEE